MVKPINYWGNNDSQIFSLLETAALSRYQANVPLPSVVEKQNLGTDKTASDFQKGTGGKPNQLLAEIGWEDVGEIAGAELPTAERETN